MFAKTKKCSECGKRFELPKYKKRLCTDCQTIYVREWRRRRKAEGRPVHEWKPTREQRRVYDRRWLNKPGNRRKKIERLNDRKKTDPIERKKTQVRNHVSHEIEMGRLKRKPCQVCGNEASQAHHEDYTKPLSITWLCREHHADRHAEMRRTGYEPPIA